MIAALRPYARKCFLRSPYDTWAALAAAVYVTVQNEPNLKTGVTWSETDHPLPFARSSRLWGRRARSWLHTGDMLVRSD